MKYLWAEWTNGLDGRREGGRVGREGGRVSREIVSE